MSGPCDDLRVIDLSSGPVAGIATMVLVDFGADVVKIERPGGDPLRRLPNAPMWLRGKRSVELDLASEPARAELHRLVAGADVVVASFRPRTAARLGADYETLAALNPGLAYCSVTAWGPRGPYAAYPGYEGLVAAKSGRMRHFAGTPGREGPAYSAVQVGSHGASQAAASGILAALLARERLGRGQLVETSLLQGLFPYDLRGLIWRQLEARYPERLAGNPYSAAPPVPTLQYHPGRWIQLANLLEYEGWGRAPGRGGTPVPPLARSSPAPRMRGWLGRLLEPQHALQPVREVAGAAGADLVAHRVLPVVWLQP